MKDNKIIWEKRDSPVTWLTFWEKPFPCEGCGKETHLTSCGDTGLHHPVCEECYDELHAYHIAVATRLLKRG